MFFLLFATNQLEPDFTVLDPLNLGFFHSLCNIGRLAWLASLLHLIELSEIVVCCYSFSLPFIILLLELLNETFLSGFPS